jgi:hypothetical protein
MIYQEIRRFSDGHLEPRIYSNPFFSGTNLAQTLKHAVSRHRTTTVSDSSAMTSQLPTTSGIEFQQEDRRFEQKLVTWRMLTKYKCKITSEMLLKTRLEIDREVRDFRPTSSKARTTRLVTPLQVSGRWKAHERTNTRECDGNTQCTTPPAVACSCSRKFYYKPVRVKN